MDNYSKLISVSESADATEEQLLELSNHKHYGIRYRVAKNVNSSESILSNLIDDNTISVRYEVAKNKNTNLRDLVKLLKDKSSIVVIAAKNNLEERTKKEITTPDTIGIRKVKLITENF